MARVARAWAVRGRTFVLTCATSSFDLGDRFADGLLCHPRCVRLQRFP